MRVFDSSVWIALFVDSDVHHARALDALEKVDDAVYIPYIVVEETASLLTYRESKALADKFLTFISNDARMVIVDSTARRDIDIFLKTRKRMSFADISIMTFASSMRFDLVTFDKQMEREFRKATRSI